MLGVHFKVSREARAAQARVTGAARNRAICLDRRRGARRKPLSQRTHRTSLSCDRHFSDAPGNANGGA